MQILHFNWLRYWGTIGLTISNSPRLAKCACFSLDSFPNKNFFNLHLLALLLPFLFFSVGDTKTIRPFALNDWA